MTTDRMAQIELIEKGAEGISCARCPPSPPSGPSSASRRKRSVILSVSDFQISSIIPCINQDFWAGAALAPSGVSQDRAIARSPNSPVILRQTSVRHVGRAKASGRAPIQ